MSDHVDSGEFMPERATVGELALSLRLTLASRFGTDEAAAMARIVLEESLRLSPVDAVLRRDQNVLPESLRRIARITQRLLAGEPIQYVYGHTQWYGAELQVTPDVLIPRPETEGLVDLIVERWGHSPDLHVVDLCTGSGCIAVTLARVLPFARVAATDVSEAALAVARDNARRHRVAVGFVRADLLTAPPPTRADLDIVVSNPPYIPLRDRAAMDANVVDHEPPAALFVPDDDPLLFYRAIAVHAARGLRPGGMVYVELDPAGSRGVAALLADAGLVDVELRRDFAGRMRYAIARQPD